MTLLRLIILWCCIIFVSPQAKAEEDQDFLRGSALYQHGKGDPANYPEALEHFKKAAERGHGRSQFYVGRMYGMESSVGIDLDMAKKWYRLAAEKGDSMAWNNLGVIYRDTREPAELIVECFNRAVEIDDNLQSHYTLGLAYRYGNFGLPLDPDKAMTHFQKAAERGHPFAAEKAALIYLKGWRSIKPDNVQAIYYFSLGAKNGHGMSMWHLGNLLQKEEIKKHYDPATLEEWTKLHQNFCDQAENDVKAVLAKVRVSYEEGNSKVAFRTLDEALQRWRSLTVDSYDWFYTFKIWDAAQFREGRSDMKWSYFLFSYIYGYHERRGEEDELAGPRNNMNDCLAELGQFGRLRESLTVTKRLIQESEEFDVDAAFLKVEVGPDYQVLRAEKLPLFVNYGDAGKNTSGEFIGGLAMTGLENVADERFARGDWKSALIIAEWCQRWTDAFKKAGVTPKRSFPAFEARFQHLPMEYRMKVFYALGLTDREMEAARQIMDMKSESHGGKWRQIAQLRMYDVAVEQGRSNEINLKELESLEENIRNNPSMQGYKWKFAKLIRAKVITKTKGLDQGLPLVKQVIEETKDDVLGPLRLEALLVAAKLSLESGVTDGVAALLGEALESARNRGLLFEEMRVYQLYVDYLLATHQYEAAIEMQNRVIELIKALKLTPRLAGALTRLDEIISLQQQKLAAPPKEPVAGTTPAPGASKGSSASPRPGMARPSLSLQPQGIRTLPIGDEASSVFLLSNFSTKPAKAAFKLKSDQLRLTLDEQLKDQITVLCKGEGGTGTHELDCQVDVPGGGQIPIILTAQGIGSTTEGTVSISLLGDSKAAIANQVSQWMIQRDSEAGMIAVVDAARLTDSNFSLVPVFHQLSSTVPDRKAELRIIASEPTRVEGYAADGTLLFIDAQGNGSFGDAGDLVATDKMDNLNPVLTSGPVSGRIALRYRPLATPLSHRLEVRIETRGIGNTEDWKVDVTDWLEP
jgi:TPR repeat protein